MIETPIVPDWLTSATTRSIWLQSFVVIEGSFRDAPHATSFQRLRIQNVDTLRTQYHQNDGRTCSRRYHAEFDA
jgi:hypothetical protein